MAIILPPPNMSLRTERSDVEVFSPVEGVLPHETISSVASRCIIAEGALRAEEAILEITAVFESWMVPDGIYPPLHKGQVVNLAFEIVPRSVERAGPETPVFFRQLGEAQCEFCAEVIWAPEKERRQSWSVLDAGSIRCCLQAWDASGQVGMRVRGHGYLSLETSAWSAGGADSPGAPDIFHVLEVTRIRRVEIPRRLISRGADGAKAMPASVPPQDFGTVTELETMEDQAFDEEFYLIDFKPSAAQGVARTIIWP